MLRSEGRSEELRAKLIELSLLARRETVRAGPEVEAIMVCMCCVFGKVRK